MGVSYELDSVFGGIMDSPLWLLVHGPSTLRRIITLRSVVYPSADRYLAVNSHQFAGRKLYTGFWFLLKKKTFHCFAAHIGLV